MCVWCPLEVALCTSRSARTAQPDRPRGRVAVFDLDRTLLAGSSLLALARCMSRNGLLSGRHLASGLAADRVFRRRGAGDEQVQRLRAVALQQVAGLEATVLGDLIDEVGVELAAQMLPAARLLVRRHHDAGDFIVILSASPQELVQVVAEQVGAHRAIGTRVECVDGRYTGRFHEPFCYGEGKLERLRAVLGPSALEGASAYADSASDLPVLLASSEPVAVNPDRRLQRVALERGWPVLRLR